MTRSGPPARPGLQPRAGHLRRGRLGQARHRRAGDGADRPGLAPRRRLDRVRDDRRRRRRRPRRRATALHRPLARRRRVPGAARRLRRRGLRPLLQHLRQPDAVVHPALPLGPLQRAGHPPQRDRGVRVRLQRRQRGPRPRGDRGDRGPGRAGRDGPRLPPLHAAGARPPRAAGRLPAPLRPHPVDAVRRLARAAQPHPRGDLHRASSPTTSSASTRTPTGATSCSAAAT